MLSDRPVVISDMGGVIYSFSKTFDPIEHSELFEKNLEWYSENIEKYKDAITEDRAGNSSLALEIEEIAVNKGFISKTEPGALPIYINSDGIVNLLKNAEKYKIVIVSTSHKSTSWKILELGIKAFGKDVALLDDIDIYDMSQYGSKKNSENWKEILKNYPNIVAVVEDSPVNLVAAYTAAIGIDPNVLKSTEMAQF